MGMRRELLLILGLATGACSSAPDHAPPATEPRDAAASTGPQPIRQLLQEHSSGVNDSTRRVINDSATLAQIWATVFARRSEAPPVPAVNFANEMVIVASMGTRSSGGYTISVDSARVAGTELQVFVRSQAPGPLCGTTGALTQPVVIVAVPRVSAVPRYVETVARTEC